MYEIIGFLAASLTTVAFVPQVMKIYKTNRTNDLSLLTFSSFSIGVFCWLIYGISLNSKPMIFANTITLILSIYILIKIIKNNKKIKNYD